jgi:hypothetical protein
MNRNSRRSALALVSVVGLVACNAQATIISLTGPAYTQDFNSLPIVAPSPNTAPWVQGTTLPGWYAYRVTSVDSSGGVASDIVQIRTSAGGVTTGDLYNFGTSSSDMDRALGSIGSNTLPGGNVTGALNASIYYVAKFVNNTGSAIDSLTVSYTGEQWRLAQDTTAAQELQFHYYTDAAAPNFGNGPAVGGWSGTQSALTFIPPRVNTNPGASSALNGNLPENRIAYNATLNLTIAPGAEFYFRWRDLNNTGNDHGVAMDDLTVSYTTVVIPEPAALGLAAMPLLAMGRRRRA